jgi:hypothetical protein
MENNKSLVGIRVKTEDDALRVYEACDFNSGVKAEVPRGAEILLGRTLENDGREWIEATLPEGTSGWVLGPSMRSHTTPVSSVAGNKPTQASTDGSASVETVFAVPAHLPKPQTSSVASVRTGSSQADAGLVRTVQDLIVTGFGIVTST